MAGSLDDRIIRLERQYGLLKRRIDQSEAQRSKLGQWFSSLRLGWTPLGDAIDTSCVDCGVPRRLWISTNTPATLLSFNPDTLIWEGEGQDNFASPPMRYQFFCSADVTEGGEQEFILVRRLASTNELFSVIAFNPPHTYPECNPFRVSLLGNTVEE